MGITERRVTLSASWLEKIQEQLAERDLDGWLLYDFHGNNPVAAGILGLPPLTRRVFVFVPRSGLPVAITHRIEQQPWADWLGENRPYLSWQSLEAELRRALAGSRVVAAEYSPDDSVPYVDRIPAGMAELIGRTGVRLASSGDLISTFYSRWRPEGVASHSRAAAILRAVAFEAFDRIGGMLRSGSSPDEWIIRDWIRSELSQRGLDVGGDAVVAVNANAANPHYAPSADHHALFNSGDLVLIDLWGKEDSQAVYADQTWMGFIGHEPPARISELWEAIRDARDSAVSLIRERTAARLPVYGYEVDDAARSLIAARGHGEAFIHRTGHSIDTELHGSGPNIDNLETRDGRRLIEGIGFSIEPGIYYPGEIGLRTEIDVFMGPDGPIVTTPEPQHELVRIV